MQACYERWPEEPGVEVIVLGCTPDERSTFQRDRRIRAADGAAEPYFLADDDCLPQRQPFAHEALVILNRHPEFHHLSLWPSFHVEPWRPQNGYDVFEDDEVMEHVSVGGIRICRPNPEGWTWPAMAGVGYDFQHAKEARRHGMRVGLIKRIRYNHLGEGYSSKNAR